MSNPETSAFTTAGITQFLVAHQASYTYFADQVVVLKSSWIFLLCGIVHSSSSKQLSVINEPWISRSLFLFIKLNVENP